MTTQAAPILDDAILAPDQIALPPQRRLMIGLLLTLTLLLHVATIGWGPIENGSGGLNAAVSREWVMGMSFQDIGKLWGETIHLNAPEALIILSFKLFGINEAAARLPFGISNLLVVWLVFLIGERMGGIWRGLSSGLVAATAVGVIVYGRDLEGASLTALLFTSALYALIRMLEQCSKIRWQALFWVTVILLCILRQPTTAWMLVGSSLVAMMVFREARIRLRGWWFSISSAVFFIAMLYGQRWGMDLRGVHGTKMSRNAAHLLWLFFPWSLAMILPFTFQLRRVLRIRSISPGEMAFWCIILLTAIWSIFFSGLEKWTPQVACLWPAFALAAGCAWERATSAMRMCGVGMVVIMAAVGMQNGNVLLSSQWMQVLHPVWWMSCGVLIVFGLSSFVSLKLKHSRTALLTLAAAAIPIAFNLLDGQTRIYWRDSMKNLGTKLVGDYRSESSVFVNEPPAKISGFLFYAPHGIRLASGKAYNQRSGVDYFLMRSLPSHQSSLEIIGRNRTYLLGKSK